MSRNRKILVVGAGVMGSYHARVVAQSDDADLMGIVDLSRDSGEDLARRYGTTWFPELPELTHIDGVIVATPTEVHFDIAIQILESGVALLLEKPITCDLVTTLLLSDLSEKKQIPFMCGFLERFNPAILTAEKLVRDPIHISATRHSPYAPRIRTGVSWDLLIHDVDLISRFIENSSPQVIHGNLGYFHPSSLELAEDVADCLIKFENGALGLATASRVGHRKIRTMSITERDRLIEIDLLRKDVTVYKNVSDQMLEDSSRGYQQETIIEIPEIVSSQEPLSAQFGKFLDLISGEADSNTERQSLLPAHRIVAQLNGN